MTTENKEIESRENEGKVHWFLSLAFTLAVTGLLFSASLVLSVSSAQAEVKRDCFAHHMQEAMTLNANRRLAYQKASNGRTHEISDTLIKLERGARVAGATYYRFDERARPYQERGIGIMCDEFVPMANTPAFVAKNEANKPSLANHSKPNTIVIAARLHSPLERGDMNSVYHIAVTEVEKLEAEPRFNCLVRHVLESIARAAKLAPDHIRKAREQNISSPLPLTQAFISSQILVLGSSARLDERAAPVQADGVPIICNDVPPIPY